MRDTTPLLLMLPLLYTPVVSAPAQQTQLANYTDGDGDTDTQSGEREVAAGGGGEERPS